MRLFDLMGWGSARPGLCNACNAGPGMATSQEQKTGQTSEDIITPNGLSRAGFAVILPFDTANTFHCTQAAPRYDGWAIHCEERSGYGRPAVEFATEMMPGAPASRRRGQEG